LGKCEGFLGSVDDIGEPSRDRCKIEQQLTTDNNLKGELQTVIDENQRLEDQINAGFSTPQRAATPNPSQVSKAAQAGTQVVDPLAQWGQKIGSDQTPQ
jgi:hypothetical protein